MYNYSNIILFSGGTDTGSTEIYEDGKFVPGPVLSPNPQSLCAAPITATNAALISRNFDVSFYSHCYRKIHVLSICLRCPD